MGANFKFEHVRIAGISTVVGNKEISIDSESQYYENADQLNRLKKTIGFDTRAIVDGTVTASDMCLQAAASLMKEMNLVPADFDAIVSVTQTPDYYMPGNAHVIHKALGFPSTCIAYDLEFGCSGYIKGLFMAYMMAEKGFGRVLLLTGDTLSKIIDVRNRADAPIFGDAGCATVIEKTENVTLSHFCLYSDGKGLETMWQQAGAYRMPSSEETKKEIRDEKGNVRTLENFYMNGFDVFSFTMTEQPKLLKEILNFSEKTVEEIDYFVLHQANKYIIETIIKKAKIPLEKAPYKTFSKYGNQSSASIPATVCSELSDTLKNKTAHVIFQGFGIGLSWGACQLELNNVTLLKPQTYEKENT